MERKYQFFILGAVALFGILAFSFTRAPSDFPEGMIFSIEEGATLRSVSRELKEADIIRSRAIFEALVIIEGGEKRILPSHYLFERKSSVLIVANRIARGKSHLAPIKVTIPEGRNTKEMAEIFAESLPSFNKANFLSEALPLEGYLFPDTYFFFTHATEKEVLETLKNNFNKKTAGLEGEITTSGKSKEDIIKMASLIEEESKGAGDSGVISGILWKRLSMGMALQADAAPETYLSKGLPKSPITNPGLSSIKAAIHPVSSPYLYYIHDKTGQIYYAKNFSEHRRNIEKYLKN